MRTRRRLLIGSFVLAVAAVVAFGVMSLSRRTVPMAPPERPFVSLEAAVASYRGWEIAVSPRLPGPYRKSLLGSSLLVAGGSNRMTSRVRDDAGSVIEEVQVESNPKFDQLAVFLDTASGDTTIVMMRRPR